MRLQFKYRSKDITYYKQPNVMCCSLQDYIKWLGSTVVPAGTLLVTQSSSKLFEKPVVCAEDYNPNEFGLLFLPCYESVSAGGQMVYLHKDRVMVILTAGQEAALGTCSCTLKDESLPWQKEKENHVAIVPKIQLKAFVQ